MFQTGPRSAALYISILSGISTLLSMYGLIVIYRATRDHMKHQIISMKFIAVQVAVILSNIQTLVFGIMARYDVPPCIQSRGPKVRASSKSVQGTSLYLVQTALKCKGSALA